MVLLLIPTTGEAPLSPVASASLSQLENQLHQEQQGASQSTSALMDKFRQYKRALAEIKNSTDPLTFDPETLASRLDEQERLQHSIFSEEEVFSLFSQRNEADKAAMERLRIRLDTQLSPQDRARLIQENLTSLPPDIALAYQPTLALRAARQLMGSSSDQQRAELVGQFGEEAGSRLHTTLQRQQQWQQQASSLASQWQQLQNDPSLGPQERRRQQQQLLVNLSPTERKRIRTYLLNSSAPAPSWHPKGKH
ncbi:hypothetical protein F0521_25980 [Ferrimonas sp. YFM]|nr:hypothetical protein F0521_25980 [Ferrimonas sp. YFM]